MSAKLELVPRGPFSLAAAAGLRFGPNEGRPAPFDGAMRLAFGVDGGRGYAGAVLRQAEVDGRVDAELETSGDGDPELALAQVARIVSLDHDGEAFTEVGERDSGGRRSAARASRSATGSVPLSVRGGRLVDRLRSPTRPTTRRG